MAETAAKSDSVASGSRTMALLGAAGFVVLVVVAECAVGYLILPSASDLARASQPQASEDRPGATGEHRGENSEESAGENSEHQGGKQNAAEHTEVKLGEFSVTSYQPTTNTSVRVEGQLYGIVKTADAAVFEELRARHEHRYREQVLVILRSAEMADLTDAGLGLIKRKILEKVNRTLGKPLLQDVIFSEFSFIEQ